MSFERLYEIGDWLVAKVIQLRPKAANRLALMVVSAGVLVLTEPLWVSILVAALQTSIDFTIHPAYGVLLIFLGLTYHYLTSKNKRGELSFSSHQCQHDTEISKRISQTLSFEDARETLEWISCHDAFFSFQNRKLYLLHKTLVAPENLFLDAELLECQQVYANSLNDLLNFLAAHFFRYPEGKIGPWDDYQNCLYPHLNSDRQGSGDLNAETEYFARSNELKDRLHCCNTAMNNLISSSKAQLGANALVQVDRITAA